jgi:hypothetical protein
VLLLCTSAARYVLAGIDDRVIRGNLQRDSVGQHKRDAKPATAGETSMSEDSAPQGRPRLNLKPRDESAAKQLEIQRTASGKVWEWGNTCSVGKP